MVNGSQYDDTIAVNGAAASVLISNAPQGTLQEVDYPSAFTGAASLTVNGNDGSDTFNVTPGAIPIFIDGGNPVGILPGDHINVLAGTANVVFTPGPTDDSGAFSVSTAGTQAISFVHIESASVTGGGGAGQTATVNGSNENDQITVTGTGTNAFTVAVSDSIDVAYTAFPDLSINAEEGSDQITVVPYYGTGGWQETVAVNGGAPQTLGGGLGDVFSLETPNTTGAAQTLSYTPTGPNSGFFDEVTMTSTITLNDIEQVFYNGGAMGDALTFNGSGGGDTITSTPGATIDAGMLQDNSLLALNYQNLGAAASVAVQDTGTGNTLVVNGTAADDVFTVAGTTGDVQLNSQIPLAPTGVQTLTLNGLAGDNGYTITAPQPYSVINVNGSGLPDPDVVNLTGNGSLATVSMGTAAPTVTQVGGLGIVDISGVGIVNLNNLAGLITADGLTGMPDAFVVSPLTATEAAIQDNGVNPVVNATTSGMLTVDPLGGGDSVTVNGTAANDTITAAPSGLDTVVTVECAGAGQHRHGRHRQPGRGWRHGQRQSHGQQHRRRPSRSRSPTTAAPAPTP